MAIMKINNINLNVEVQGSGEPLILIHGLTGDLSQFALEIPRLALKYKTISLDCRGHGKSDKPAHYTLNDHVQDVIALMDTFDLKTTNIYGISMGSYIAQGVAIEQPQRVKKLILGVTKTNGLTSSTQRLMTEHASELANLNQEDQLKYLMKYIVHNRSIFIKNPDVLKSTLTPEETMAANRALLNFDNRDKLSQITAKTLVFSGKYDGLNPPEEGKLCASLIPNATFIEMQHSGHVPMLEEQEICSRLVDKFLAQ